MSAEMPDSRRGNWKDPAEQARKDFYAAFDKSGLKLERDGERMLAKIFERTVLYAIYRCKVDWEKKKDEVLLRVEEIITKVGDVKGQPVPPYVLEDAADAVVKKYKAECSMRIAQGKPEPRWVFCTLYEADPSAAAVTGSCDPPKDLSGST